MAIDSKKIEKCIREILIALGDDPAREGLKETPLRVAKMYQEVFEGMNYTNDELVEMFNKTFEDVGCQKENNDIVVVKNIEIFSFCEHHMALMYNMKVTVAYIPKEKVIGLSKIARISEMVGKRLQLQEKIGNDIAYIIGEIAQTSDVAVIIEGNHSCMTSRGIKNTNALTKTLTFRGTFLEDEKMISRLMMLI